MARCARFAIWLLPFLLAACGRVWEPTSLPGTGSSAQSPYWVLPKPDSLRPSLMDCVGQNDPAHLYELDNGGDYDLSGPFASEKLNAVRKCMLERGWQDIPTWAGP